MGKPGKLKSGSKLKVKKWAKGSSCVSNPDIQKHREKAKGRFFHMQPTTKSNKGLTLEALKIHDEMQATGSTNGKQTPMDEEGSEGGHTFGTFLSGLSDCTNVTFGKIQRYWMNNSAQHKEVCAVLAAITEVIRGQGAVESNTAYFAALVTALSSVEETESAAAVAYLLAMTCKQVPVAVLRAKFGEVSKLLSNILVENSTADGNPPTALIRSVLSCQATVLRQQGKLIWNEPSTLNMFHTILTYTVHGKPKIRKAAHNAVCSVLFASSFTENDTQTAKTHPAAAQTSKFCVAHLEKFGGVSSAPSVCHMLTLLGRVLHTFPQQSLKRCCETILRLMTLSEPVVKSVCLQTLHHMFINQPMASNLPADLNAQIVSALYDYYPNSADAQMCPAWLAVMEKALLHLSNWYSGGSLQHDANSLALAHIPKLMITCFKMMLSTSRVVCESAAGTINMLLKECSTKVLDGPSKVNETKFITSLVKLLDDSLKYKFHAVWDLMFGIIQTAFKHVLKSSHFAFVKALIVNIADLRNTPQFLYKAELDASLGQVVEEMGPKLFLQAAPLNIDGTESDYDFPRSWFMPLLNKHVVNTEIEFYVDYFLPLAGKVRLRAAELKARGHKVEATTYETIQHQCWLLLPSFCKGATDIAKSFPKLAKILGQALTEQDNLKLLVLKALRNLLISCKSSEEDTKVMARFAKNYLPLMFNIYTSPESMPGLEADTEKQSIIDANKQKSPERLSTLETIKLYLEITDQSIIQSYFVKAQNRVFDGDGENDATRLALLDLLINMVARVTVVEIKSIYQAMLPMLGSPNHSMQKKAYRLLEEICGSSTEECHKFISSHLQELKARLLDGLVASSPSSKGPRINCMEKIIQQLAANGETQSECIEFVQAIIPEVVMCTKEAKRSRIAAFNLLVSAAKIFVSLHNDNEGLTVYFDTLFNGLAGDPMMIKSTILALCRLVYEFKDQLPSQLLDQTINNICLLLGCNTREVCKAALSFIMVLFSILDRATLAQYTKNILDSLLNWKPETTRHFRFRIKRLLQRLVQKFGFETINSMTPPAHKKQLQNIRKVNDRTQRTRDERKESKNEKSQEMDTFVKSNRKETIDEILADSEDSEDDEPKTKRSKQNKEKKAWLQDSQVEPMDLLDPTTSRQVLAVNPTNRNQQSRKPAQFKSAPDGRLIIGDEATASDDDDDVETKKLLTGLGINKETAKVGSKRKMESDNSRKGNSDGYQPGGKGIHRKLNAEPVGSPYRAKKSGGDVKRKGKPDPYAYLPLNAQMINKRKQKKLSGQYAGLVKAAKKGAAGGSKLKSKRKRK